MTDLYLEDLVSKITNQAVYFFRQAKAHDLEHYMPFVLYEALKNLGIDRITIQKGFHVKNTGGGAMPCIWVCTNYGINKIHDIIAQLDYLYENDNYKHFLIEQEVKDAHYTIRSFNNSMMDMVYREYERSIDKVWELCNKETKWESIEEVRYNLKDWMKTQLFPLFL
jgi:hypothetical protein